MFKLTNYESNSKRIEIEYLHQLLAILEHFIGHKHYSTKIDHAEFVHFDYRIIGFIPISNTNKALPQKKKKMFRSRQQQSTRIKLTIHENTNA